MRWLAVGSLACAVIDLTCALSLLAIGASQGTANLVAVIVGYLALLAIRAASGAHSSGRAELSIAIAFLAVALRGGVVSSAIGLGASAPISVLTGVLMSWAAIYLGNAWRDTPLADPIHPSISSWSGRAASILAIAVVLRIAYLDVLPLLPEEAYYWNYAKHLDIGYLDHPPLVAWLIALGEFLIGHTKAGLRFGSLLAGLVTITFVYCLARRLVDQPSALMAAALAAALPFLFGVGVMMTPDAPLMAAWSAALYFLHGALVLGHRTAWFPVGLAIGVGLLSKYTIALLGLTVVAFVLLDQRSRHWLTRWEPYAAVAIAVTMFVPVIVWNYQHDWASFLFQAWDRFGGEPAISLHVLLMNVLVVATPLSLYVLPLLFTKRWTRESPVSREPEHATPRNRLFVICCVLAPLLVFIWSALKHAPRLNWTAPIWLAVLPLLGWTIIHVGSLHTSRWGAAMHRLARPLTASMLMLTAALLYFLVLGIPGVSYPKSLARAMGWATATEHLQQVHDRLSESSGSAPIIVGMDKYFTAAQLSYHASQRPEAMRVTTKGVVFGGEGLMFDYWHAPEHFTGRTLIMVTRRKAELTPDRLASFFQKLDSQLHLLEIVHDGPGGNGQLIDRYYYRIGHGYRPER